MGKIVGEGLKIIPFQKRLSCEQQVRVSVSEYPDDDLCFVEKSPEIDSPGESLTPVMMMRTRDGAVTPTPGSAPPRSPRLSRAASFQEEFQRSEERGFQESAEKVMIKYSKDSLYVGNVYRSWG